VISLTQIADLSSIQLDAMREVGNIGAGHAATVLSQLLKQKVEMAVPRVSVTPLTEAANFIGIPEKPMVGVYLRVFGDAPSKILYLYPKEQALFLAGLLLGETYKVRNILTGAYVNAFSSFTRLNMISSVPALAFDMVAAIVNTVLADQGEVGDYALIIETKLTTSDSSINGHFFLVPDPDSLGVILETLGVKGECQNSSGSGCQK
jgi:chemotaxis protein CheC